MDGLLRKKDLVEALKPLAKSTIADWVTEFGVYIPIVKHGAVTYYKPEAVDVLKAIRELREKDQSKVQIMELLAKKGFSITVEEAVEDIERIISGSDPRDTLLTVMQTMGQAVVKIGDQEGRINRVETRFEEQSERIDGQDGRILTVEEKQDEQAELVDELMRRVIEAEERSARAEAAAAAAQEQANKSIWKRILGK